MGFKAAAQTLIVLTCLIANGAPLYGEPPAGWSNGANRTDELYGYMYDRLPAWRANWEPLLSVEPDLVYFIQHWNVDEQ